MTVLRENCATERTRQLHLAQLLHGPAQRALAYCYSYCYTRSSDVLGYISKQDLRLQFTDDELLLLARSRSPKLFTIPTLYKIFKFCCEDALEDRYSKDWSTDSNIGRPSSLEAHIAAIYHQYQTYYTTTAGDVEGLTHVILGVVKVVGERLGVNKWKQQYDALKQAITEILDEVQPAIDVKDRVANAAKIEADILCQSLTSAVARLADAERSRTGDAKEEVLQDIDTFITVVKGDTPEQGENAIRVSSTDLLDELRKHCTEKIDGKQICCISGEHGTGKTTLAAKFPVCWTKQQETIKGITNYDYILSVSGKDIELTSIDKWIGITKSAKSDLSNFIDSYWSVVEAFLPRCCAKYGVKNVGQLLIAKKVLFIIDDADEISDGKVKELILFLGQIIFDSSVIILGNFESISKIKLNFISFSSVQHFHLHGICKDAILEMANDFKDAAKTGKKKVQKTFKDSIKVNMNRFGSFFEYPELFKETYMMWKSKTRLVKEIYSVSELLWNLILFKSNTALEVDLNKDIRKKKRWFMWIMVVGEMCHYCLRANIKLNDASFAEIKKSAEKLFSAEESERLIAEFFKKRLILNSSSFQSSPCTMHRPQLEFFSSYYVANKLRLEETLLIKDFLPKVAVEDFVCMVGGHLWRWDMADIYDGISEEVDIEVLRRIVSDLVTYDPAKLEDLNFYLRMATEFHCSHKLVQFMVNVTEYPEEWDLKLCLIQQRSIEVLLQHVGPVRIILRTDETIQTYEQLSVLKFLGKVPISVWFESRDQFKYGNTKTMDKVLRPFFTDKSMARVDLLSGSLSRTSILDFSDFKCMSYIVMLALRVTDEPTLQSAVALPSHLPHILWFELKIEMPVENITLTSLPKMEVEMFDVYLRDLDDLAVPKITGLLTKLHKRYTGIHLERTTLAPESIYTLLKNLKQRKIALCATANSIDKYRRWYYPLLSSLPTDKLLTDKEVKKILGFEDRRFYSDHKICSSTFVRSIDAWNLTSYLEDLKEIKYFHYKADNLSFTKTLKGEVETKLCSEIKVGTTETIL